jgi:hypothetical protein
VKEGLSILPEYLKGLKISLLILLLVVVVLAMYPLGNAVEANFPKQNPAEIAAFSINDTVFSGTDVVSDFQIRKVPTIYHPEYLVDHIKNGRIYEFFDALVTGTVKTPMEKTTGGSISNYGVAQGFNGPGMLTVKDDKLVVNPPANFVWGFKIPYVYAEKTNNGIEIKQGDKTLNKVPYDQINNDTVPHENVAVEDLKEWYNRPLTHEGDQKGLTFGLGNFSDGRNFVPPYKIKTLFGDEVAAYTYEYASGAPVMIYSNYTTEKEIANSSSLLESFPQYGDAGRAENARQFAIGWNNTIIPPHATSPGRVHIYFGGLPDPKAPGGSASHGVCPPGRALRGVVLAAGFPLPTGMTMDYFCIAYGFNPTSDVRVTNTANYPVKITMWTEGSGPSMIIHANMVELHP